MESSVPKNLNSSDIHAGQRDEFFYEITEEKVKLFSEISGDFNPLHIDRNYANSVGLSGPVVHGAFQQALVSQAVGMRVIGLRCLVKSYASKFLKPLIYPVSVRVSSEVLEWSQLTSSGKVLTRISDGPNTICYSETIAEVLFHSTPEVTPKIMAPDAGALLSGANIGGFKTNKPVVLVVGASSGLFQSLLTDLLEGYDLILMARRVDNLEDFASRNSPNIVMFAHDFQVNAEQDFFDKLMTELAGRPLWGILYGASLAPGNEDILKLDRLSFENSILFGGYVPVLLAKTLANFAQATLGGRLVLIGSNYATHNSPKTGAVMYGLSKSSLVTVTKAVAIELAKKKITVNVISPDFMAVGMNSQASERSIQIEIAGNPMKQICTPLDVLGAIKYFLSAESKFVTAQELILSGGKS